MEIVTISIGTTKEIGNKLIKREFRDLSWWSDNNIETLAHYYEGCVIEIKVELDYSKKMEYIRELNTLPSEYTFGFAEMECPKGAIWYSFSGEYLKNHVIEVKEIFPDISGFDD